MKSIRHKLLALSVSCALAVSLAGCGVNVTGVTLNLPDSMEKGTTLTATPEYAFDGATPESAALAKKLDTLDMSYTSSDPAVLVVDENGNMVAVSAGTAEVALSSKDGKITASKTIEVIVTPTDITTTDALTLTAGETATLETAVAPDDATHVAISYTSSDDAVATVSDVGEVTAVAAGDATITAAVDGTALSAVCKVTVLPAIESIELNYTALSLRPDGTAQLTYTVAPEEALADDVTYTSRDEAVATVDAEGNVTELTPIQKAFIEKFSFQCGYCTPGFVAGATAFIDRLKHEPVKRADLESAIEDALNDHICRCTGYVRYYEAVRDVALATPGCEIGSVD